MRKTLWIGAVVSLFGITLSAAAQQTAQQTTQQSSQQASSSQAKPDPLVEAARKARAESKTAPKAVRVFTNDNLPTAGNSISVVGNATPSNADEQSNSFAQANAKSSANSNSSSADDEASWRKRFAQERRKLQDDETALSVMQRELGQLQLQYYPDPQKSLMQSVTRGDITKKQDAIDKKKQDIEADKQALSDLQDALRKSGNPVSWGESQ